jgi:RNA recognition motif-containing protein
VAPINTIWVGGVTVSLSEQQLDRHFSRYGRVTRVVINRMTSQALISFDSVESASIAQAQMKGRNLFGRRVRVCPLLLLLNMQFNFIFALSISFFFFLFYKEFMNYYIIDCD